MVKSEKGKISSMNGAMNLTFQQDGKVIMQASRGLTRNSNELAFYDDKKIMIIECLQNEVRISLNSLK